MKKLITRGAFVAAIAGLAIPISAPGASAASGYKACPLDPAHKIVYISVVARGTAKVTISYPGAVTRTLTHTATSSDQYGYTFRTGWNRANWRTNSAVSSASAGCGA